MKEQMDLLDTELKHVKMQNETLKQQAIKMVEDVEKLQRKTRDQERNVITLRDQLESKSRLCQDSEVSLAHLSKTLDDLTKNFESAKANAEHVMTENDKLRADMRINNANMKVYENQIKSLKHFIEDLENSNKGLARQIDQKHLMHADDYRSKVSNALSHHQFNRKNGGNQF